MAGATGETPVAVMGEVRQVCKHTNFICSLSPLLVVPIRRVVVPVGVTRC